LEHEILWKTGNIVFVLVGALKDKGKRIKDENGGAVFVVVPCRDFARFDNSRNVKMFYGYLPRRRRVLISSWLPRNETKSSLPRS
jgi:hypothetical protein